jgi:hypothetical protein
MLRLKVDTCKIFISALDVTQGVKQTETELRRIFERIGDLTGVFSIRSSKVGFRG